MNLKGAFVVILLLLCIHMVIMDSGLCYREMRWLSKQEIVDRALFEDKANKLSLEEKITYVVDKYAAKYPEFCKVNSIPFTQNNWGYNINLIFGRRIYGVECVHPLDKDSHRTNKTEKYYWFMSSVDACDFKGLDKIGISITEKEYDVHIKKNREFWKENKQWQIRSGLI